jgi:hypothetical protein
MDHADQFRSFQQSRNQPASVKDYLAQKDGTKLTNSFAQIFAEIRALWGNLLPLGSTP